MKKVLIFFLFFSFVEINFAQTKETNDLSETIIAYDSVEVKPEFQGGLIGFYNFVGRNFRVPEDKKLNGKIEVQFVIEKDGSISNIKVIKDLGHGTGKEAIRVMKKCPKWVPGRQNGEVVRVSHFSNINISG